MAAGEIHVLKTAHNPYGDVAGNYNMFQALEFIRNHPNDAPPYSIVAQIGNFDRGNRIQIVGRIIDINEGRPIAGRRLNEIQITIEDREGIHPVTVMMASNLRHLQVLEDRRTHA